MSDAEYEELKRQVVGFHDANGVIAKLLAEIERMRGLIYAIPTTPEKMVAFIGSNFNGMQAQGWTDALPSEPTGDLSAVVYSLSVHDLLSAFWWSGLGPDDITPRRCEYCDGTGDVHGLDGEWRGECTACKPGVAGVNDYPGLDPDWPEVMGAVQDRDGALLSATIKCSGQEFRVLPEATAYARAIAACETVDIVGADECISAIRELAKEPK